MTRLKLGEMFIKNFKEEIGEGSTAYMTKEDAYYALKKWTGQDFGYDADKWKKWIEKNGFPVLGIHPREEFDE